MKLVARGILTLLLLGLPIFAQEQPPVPPAIPPTLPAVPATLQAVPATPVLENSGQPMLLPFHCTDADIQSAGLTCSEDDPCPIYLELASVAAHGTRIIAAGNLHSAAVTMYTVVLVSEDAGRTWIEAHERIRGAGFDHIQILDPETAWISGLTLFPLPQDPFLLLTTDGGKTWRQRPIAGESRPGAIQQFFFSSREDGALLIDRGPAETGDRYERFQSSDGGESWTIQEESPKPLKLKQTETASPDWRLQVDSATQAYHLERRQGTRWIKVAPFAVKIGVCRPDPGGPDPGGPALPPGR
jgi:hypothetical protein